MLYKLFTLFLVFISNLTIYSQSNEILFTIENQNTYTEEFINKFKRNYEPRWLKDKDTVQKFLDQYILYKQAVMEAELQGLNNSEAFREEIDAFRKQILSNEITDSETLEFFAKQVYERSKIEIHIKHILIRIDPHAAPKDTLLAYQKALNIRKKIVNGENFGKLAITISDDPSAINNGGDLWYVKPLMVPLAIEDYIYNNPKEKISYPVRSYLGYHVIEIIDKRPSPGRYKVAHIMLAFPLKSDEKIVQKSKLKADSIYNLIRMGQDFNLLAQKYSDDKGTSSNGGELPWFETGKMPREFEIESFNLKSDGEVSKPVKTNYGWHIIKRLSQAPDLSFEQIKQQLINKIKESERGKIAESVKIEKLKKINQFKEFYNTETISNNVDSSIFEAKWQIPFDVDLATTMFSIADKKFTQLDFANYLQSTQKKMYPFPIQNFIQLKYNEYVNQCIKDFFYSNIEKNYPELNMLIHDYEESILYSKIMEKEIWKKAADDVNGLKDYYKNNKSHYNKTLVADVCIYSYQSPKSSKIERNFKNFKIGDVSDSLLVNKMRKSVDPTFSFSGCLKEEEGKNEIIDECIHLYKSGLIKKEDAIIHLESRNKLVYMNDEIKPTNKPLEEVKNSVLEDFRNYLENLFNSKLRNKFIVAINQKAVESIINN